MEGYRHISFRKEWEIDTESAYMLGECRALVRTLTDIPLQPELRGKLLAVSLIKGAHATTAIEGNTLSEEEVARIQEGWDAPPSKEYLQIEVNNILEAFNTLLHELADEGRAERITPELIRRFHGLIGRNLGDHFDAVPGRFREDRRVVGRYLAPEHGHVPRLVRDLCDWLDREFRYTGGQSFPEAVIEAIVAHVYIEWIHPFGDGNGRTGRLAEFYVLLRAGLPSIVSHILSNHYNLTRSEYYRQLERARQACDLAGFIKYALRGFRDGLQENFDLIQKDQFLIFWRHYIYERFAALQYTKSEVFKRKRALILHMPIDRKLTAEEMVVATPDIARRYAKVGKATVARDIRELVEMGLLVRDGRRFVANTAVLKAMMPKKREALL